MEPVVGAWCIAGIFVIIITGSIIHFFYPWSGESIIMGLMFPVNESVWEHLKLGYWALVMFSIPEYFFINKLVNNYFLAKLTGIIALELTVLIVFYGYFLFTCRSIFWINIASFVLGALACQFSVYRIFHMASASNQIAIISLAGLLLMPIIFGILTLYPPHYGIFEDKREHIFGINKEK